MTRDYKRERLNESKDRKEARKARGRARYAMGIPVGDSRTVQHKKPLSRGGSNARSNLSTVSKTANSREGGRLGKGKSKPRRGK